MTVTCVPTIPAVGGLGGGGGGNGVRVPTQTRVAVTATAPDQAALKANGTCDTTHVLRAA